jgi:hypothetical protein
VPYADDPASAYLRVTLDDGLDEAGVRTAVDGLEDGFDEDVPDSVQVVFDAFSALVHPGQVDTADPDLERALWLRADGRATWFGPGPHFRPGDALSRSGTNPLVLAPATDVVQLALDLDAAVPGVDEVRRSFAVGSPDGSMRVQWSNYPTGLDRDALSAFATLQGELPGTTGWYDDSEGTVGVHVDPAALALDEWLERGPELVAGLPVREVGWGPLRAESFQDLRELGAEVRPVLGGLLAAPGVRAVTHEGVQVEDLATLDVVRRLLPEETFSVVREPSDLIGFAPDPVVSIRDVMKARTQYVLRQVVDLDGVRQLAGSLVLEADISDEVLLEVLGLLKETGIDEAGLPVQVGIAPIYRVSEAPTLGTLTPMGFEPESEPRAPATAELADRVAAAFVG